MGCYCHSTQIYINKTRAINPEDQPQDLSLHRLTSTVHTNSQMDSSQVPFTAARIKEWNRGKRGKVEHKVFFFPAAEELLGCSGAFRWKLFSTQSDGAPILQTALLSASFSFSELLFFLSLFQLLKRQYTCLYNSPTGLCLWLDPW